MKWIMRKCVKCNRYTLRQDICPKCGGELIVPHPPRFSPEDKYVELRLKMKIESNILNTNEKPFYCV
ncbi:MAG: RNA-protein complex protein Nop10 [Desulfurococcaceae archaeon]|uniref:Ribosome biogenesis protein Nop10 n=1 Tax=Staphylothermus marinus TaxID=2280 RepID=A0A7C4HDM6_STAMA